MIVELLLSFKEKTYVWGRRWQRGIDYFGIEFMFSKRLPVHSFRFFIYYLKFVYLFCCVVTSHSIPLNDDFLQLMITSWHTRTHIAIRCVQSSAKLHRIQQIVCFRSPFFECIFEGKNRFCSAKKDNTWMLNSLLKFWTSPPKCAMPYETCSMLVQRKQKR